ncbi:hypothetical protein FGO68_gene9406 [Halteria grandinella]|uniref:RING-type domain-containing protein n=1 Tax=Halteria grandinella TaxID=5974 RepID=A0A8J8NVN9_HALGN|nr:hypothetical protein FGO68_gene9406 [Halteria grandinella]
MLQVKQAPLQSGVMITLMVISMIILAVQRNAARFCLPVKYRKIKFDIDIKLFQEVEVTRKQSGHVYKRRISLKRNMKQYQKIEEGGFHCVICMASLNEPPQNSPIADLESKIKFETPCRHVFHDDCLNAWIKIKRECPTCRHSLPDRPGLSKFSLVHYYF